MGGDYPPKGTAGFRHRGLGILFWRLGRVLHTGSSLTWFFLRSLSSLHFRPGSWRVLGIPMLGSFRRNPSFCGPRLHCAHPLFRLYSSSSSLASCTRVLAESDRRFGRSARVHCSSFFYASLKLMLEWWLSHRRPWLRLARVFLLALNRVINVVIAFLSEECFCW